MKCEKTKNLLPDYIGENLDSAVRFAVEEHLAGCPNCRAEFEMAGDLWAKLDLLPEEQPGENLRPKFYAMLSAYKQGMETARSKNGVAETLLNWLERLWPAKPAFQLGFAVLFLLFGLFLGRSVFAPGSGNGELAQLHEEVRNLNNLVSLSLLQQQSPSDRLKGVSYSQQMRQPDQEVLIALIQTLNHDNNVNVRLAAADALASFINEQLVKKALIEALLHQSSPLVQIELIDILVRNREKESIDVFQELLQAEEINQAVKQRAQWGIQQLG